jgi:hypothetical protein
LPDACARLLDAPDFTDQVTIQQGGVGHGWLSWLKSRRGEPLLTIYCAGGHEICPSIE